MISYRNCAGKGILANQKSNTLFYLSVNGTSSLFYSAKVSQWKQPYPLCMNEKGVNRIAWQAWSAQVVQGVRRVVLALMHSNNNFLQTLAKLSGETGKWFTMPLLSRVSLFHWKITWAQVIISMSEYVFLKVSQSALLFLLVHFSKHTSILFRRNWSGWGPGLGYLGCQ